MMSVEDWLDGLLKVLGDTTLSVKQNMVIRTRPA